MFLNTFPGCNATRELSNTTDSNSTSNYNFTLDTLKLEVYVRKTYRPNKNQYDWKFILPQETNVTFDKCNPPPPEQNFTVFIRDEFVTPGDYWFAVSYLAPPGVTEYEMKQLYVNYTVRIITSQCKYWDDAEDKWSSEGCHVSRFFEKISHISASLAIFS